MMLKKFMGRALHLGRTVLGLLFKGTKGKRSIEDVRSHPSLEIIGNNFVDEQIPQQLVHTVWHHEYRKRNGLESIMNDAYKNSYNIQKRYEVL